MDRTPRPPDRCQRILDLIDACLAEYGVGTRPLEPATVRRPRPS